MLSQTLAEVLETETVDLFKIEGKVEVVSTQNKDWIGNTRILVDGGDYIAHLRYSLSGAAGIRLHFPKTFVL